MKAFIAAVTAALLVGCGSDPGVEVDISSTQLVFESFRASTPFDDLRQMYILEGDILVSEEQLRDLFERYIAPNALILTTLAGSDNKWAPGSTLEYCVRNDGWGTSSEGYAIRPFVLGWMSAAAKSWSSSGNILIVHDVAEDARCDYTGSQDPNLPQVTFRVWPTSGSSMSPLGPAGWNPRTNILYLHPFSNAGVAHHEVGHYLGFHHEHLQAANNTCPDSSWTWRSLTAFDPDSVMIYRNCVGLGGGVPQALSPFDMLGAAKAYGAATVAKEWTGSQEVIWTGGGPEDPDTSTASFVALDNGTLTYAAPALAAYRVTFENSGFQTISPNAMRVDVRLMVDGVQAGKVIRAPDNGGFAYILHVLLAEGTHTLSIEVRTSTYISHPVNGTLKGNPFRITVTPSDSVTRTWTWDQSIPYTGNTGNFTAVRNSTTYHAKATPGNRRIRFSYTQHMVSSPSVMRFDIRMMVDGVQSGAVVPSSGNGAFTFDRTVDLGAGQKKIHFEVRSILLGGPPSTTTLRGNPFQLVIGPP